MLHPDTMGGLWIVEQDGPAELCLAPSIRAGDLWQGFRDNREWLYGPTGMNDIFEGGDLQFRTVDGRTVWLGDPEAADNSAAFLQDCE